MKKAITASPRQHQVFCEVCRKPVVYFEMIADPTILTYVVGVKCHGKTETLDFTHQPPALIRAFAKEAAELEAQQEQVAAAPADYFVCMSMLVTGRHKHPNLMLGKVDMIARDIALEGNP